MKRKILCLLLFCSIVATAQDVDCNQKVWPPRKNKTTYMPQGVCIPEGMFNYITYVRDRTDINGDGLDDFVCGWNAKPLHDGDTLYLSVYFQNPDSTFSHFRTFNNLKPIYFKWYYYDYIPEDPSLISLVQKYQDVNPLREIIFEKNLITIRMVFAASEELLVTYYFDKEKQDWMYKQAEIRSTIGSDVESIDLEDKIGPSISKFTYFYWEEDSE